MANLPKIRYKGTVVNDVSINDTEINYIYKDNKLIFHKHFGNSSSGGGCFTNAKTGYNICGRQRGNDGGEYVDDPCPGSIYYSASGNWGCRICGMNYGSTKPSSCTASWFHWVEYYSCPVHGGRSRNGGTCGYRIPYTYYELGCGYTGETTEADITDVSDLTFVKE